MRHSAAALAAGDDRAVEAGAVGDQLGRGVASLRVGVACGLDEQPAAAARQVGHGGAAAAGPDDVDEPRVEALQGHRQVREQRWHRLGGGRHVGVAEHGERGGLRRRDQADGRAQREREGALGAGEELRHVGPVFRQQVLQGVAGDLAGEPAELGADRGQVVADQGRERGEHARLRAGCPGPGGAGVTPEAARGEPRAAAGDDVQRDHVVRGTSVAQRPRAAGVVADRAADGRARVRGRVGAEAEAVRRGRRGDRVQNGPGFHHRDLFLGVDAHHPVEVPRQVEHDAGAQRVARDRGATAAGHDGHAEFSADRKRGHDLVGVPGECHDRGDDPVVGRVRGVFRPPPGRRVDLGEPGRAQGGR